MLRVPWVAIRLGCLWIACALSQAALYAADWPQWRGPNADGISPETGINKDWGARPPKVLWRVGLSDNGYAGPSAAAGRVFILDHQGEYDVLRVLDLATGADTPESGYSYPEPGGENFGFSRATPAIVGGRAYLLSRSGQLHCVDLGTRTRVWARDILNEFQGRRPTWDYSYSPVVDVEADGSGGQVIVCPGGPNAAVVAVDMNTGETVWAGGGSDVPGYATPVIATIQGRKQYVVFTGVSLIGVDAATGALLWRVQWQTEYDCNAATPIVVGDFVFFSSGYGRGCALVEITGAGPKWWWENRELQAHFSSPIYYNGFIFGVGDPGDLICLEPSTGRCLWRQGGFEKGTVLGVDGVLIAQRGHNGELVMVKAVPDGYQELGRFRALGGQSWTAPILSEGKLVVRNKQAIACLDLR